MITEEEEEDDDETGISLLLQSTKLVRHRLPQRCVTVLWVKELSEVGNVISPQTSVSSWYIRNVDDEEDEEEEEILVGGRIRLFIPLLLLLIFLALL